MKIKAFFENNFDLFILVLSGAFLFFFVLGLILGRFLEKIKSEKRIKKARADSLKKSRAVLKGQIYEELAPYFPNFPVNPKALKFLGMPVDYIAFVNNFENPDIIEKIIFIEIKTGTSNLTTTQKSIKQAIKENKVYFLEYRL